MKSKTFKKNLMLRKKTVANLDLKNMNLAKGGSEHQIELSEICYTDLCDDSLCCGTTSCSAGQLGGCLF